MAKKRILYMHVAMLRRTVLSREVDSGNNTPLRGNRTHSSHANPPIIIGLISIIMLVIVTSTGQGGEIELRDGVKAMHTCSWSTGTTDSVNEGVTAVETLSATSDASGTCSYSISGGVDSGDFVISGSALSFSATPDYENPADSNSDNQYVVNLLATDSADSATTGLTLTVTVNDLTLAIAASQSFSIDETVSTGDSVGTVALSADTATAWSILTNGADSDEDGTKPFAISSSGTITVADSGDIDYETTTSYTLAILAANSDESDIETLTVTIGDINPTITDTSGTISETAADATAVVDVDMTGDDSSITWSITTNGADADSDGTDPFSINSATGAITLADSGDLDFETTAVYNLVVRITDGNTADTETITITVTDVAPTVTVTSANLGETTANGATVVDVDNTGDDCGAVCGGLA